MDLNDVEKIDVKTLGGADNINVNDLTGTDVTQVDIDLGAGGGGDASQDTVVVNGTNGNDIVQVLGSAGSVSVVGLPALVSIAHSEAANDRLIVNGGTGNDIIFASTLANDTIGLTLDGGDGTDALVGSQGNDVILGGNGNDIAFGMQGDDLAVLGAGDDLFVWNPGDGSDTVEGQDGTDQLIFIGSGINENIDISANGERIGFHRDVANITMDLNGVEGIIFHALGGADNIVVNDLIGTHALGVAIDLEGAVGSGVGDGAVDHVTVTGTAGSDSVIIAGANGNLAVVGLPSAVAIGHADATDVLTFNAGDGNDVIDASGLASGTIGLNLNGGLGNDVFLGSQGDDLIVGGDGLDTAIMGAGNDVFVWNPGDDNDAVDGQAGVDTLLFNGANVAENITISANGEGALFSRDIANVNTFLNNVETIDFHALGGPDTIMVNDMSGTDVSKVNIDLAAAGGVGDGEVDTIVINATSGNDVISISNNNGVVTVSGLAALVTISGFEATDRIVINGLAGDDVIEATGLGTAMQFTANGGDGNDALVGSQGNDVLRGDAGDDVLVGGDGLDVLDGGIGNNIIIQDWII
jgi:Ca2+-binding RTX toxin-like protein